MLARAWFGMTFQVYDIDHLKEHIRSALSGVQNRKSERTYPFILPISLDQAQHLPVRYGTSMAPIRCLRDPPVSVKILFNQAGQQFKVMRMGLQRVLNTRSQQLTLCACQPGHLPSLRVGRWQFATVGVGVVAGAWWHARARVPPAAAVAWARAHPMCGIIR